MTCLHFCQEFLLSYFNCASNFSRVGEYDEDSEEVWIGFLPEKFNAEEHVLVGGKAVNIIDNPNFEILDKQTMRSIESVFMIIKKVIFSHDS